MDWEDWLFWTSYFTGWGLAFYWGCRSVYWKWMYDGEKEIVEAIAERAEGENTLRVNGYRCPVCGGKDIVWSGDLEGGGVCIKCGAVDLVAS